MYLFKKKYVILKLIVATHVRKKLGQGKLLFPKVLMYWKVPLFSPEDAAPVVFKKNDKF